MKSTVETLSPTRVRLSVEVSFEELEPSVRRAYRSISDQVRIPGFRPGKVPPRLIDQRIGRAVVRASEDARNNASCPNALGASRVDDFLRAFQTVFNRAIRVSPAESLTGRSKYYDFLRASLRRSLKAFEIWR